MWVSRVSHNVDGVLLTAETLRPFSAVLKMLAHHSYCTVVALDNSPFGYAIALGLPLNLKTSSSLGVICLEIIILRQSDKAPGPLLLVVYVLTFT